MTVILIEQTVALLAEYCDRVVVIDQGRIALDGTPTDVFSHGETLRTGMTVILIEQTVALLAEYCDRVVVIDQGRIALDGTPTDVFSHGETLRAIGVDTPRTVRISNSLAEAGLAPDDSPALTLDGAESLVAGILAPGLSESSPIAPCALDDRPDARDTADKRPIVVDVAGAAYSYGTGQAGIEGINLTVRAGEILAVVGQNGAGKTTFTKLLNGLIKPSAGVVRITGLDTRTTPVSALASHAATLFQNPDRQLCRNTVVEEISFGLELQGASADAARERARHVAATFGLPENASPFNLSRGQRQMVALASVVALEPELIILDEPTSGLDVAATFGLPENASPFNLSRGQRQMVALASVVALEPELIILDEPTSGLDYREFGLPENASPFNLSRGQRQMVALASVVALEPELIILDEPTSGLDYRECMTVMETVRQRALDGAAVVMVCHDMEVVSDFADTLAVMAEGRLIEVGPCREVFANDALLAHARIASPCVPALGKRLAARLHPSFARITEVTDLVALVKELKAHA